MIGFALAGPEKMAIAGDDKWQDEAFAFTAKGFRATAIEFFTPSRLNEATHVAEFLDHWTKVQYQSLAFFTSFKSS